MSREFSIALANGAAFTALPDENILTAAQRAHWLIRYGCRNGNCNACEAILLQGSVLQRGYLIESTNAPHKILLCQCSALSDVQLELATNPIHGSADQARRCYAKLIEIGGDKTESILRFQLPVGRSPNVNFGQYAVIETDAGNIYCYVHHAKNKANTLLLDGDSELPLKSSSYYNIRYPLGYCYNEDSSQRTLILVSEQHGWRGRLFKEDAPTATLMDGADILQLAGEQFEIILACGDNEEQIEQWHAQLLQLEVGFRELRSDNNIRYRQ